MTKVRVRVVLPAGLGGTTLLVPIEATATVGDLAAAVADRATSIVNAMAGLDSETTAPEVTAVKVIMLLMDGAALAKSDVVGDVLRDGDTVNAVGSAVKAATATASAASFVPPAPGVASDAAARADAEAAAKIAAQAAAAKAAGTAPPLPPSSRSSSSAVVGPGAEAHPRAVMFAYRTAEDDDFHDIAAVPEAATLRDLKAAIARACGVPFTPDADPSATSGGGASTGDSAPAPLESSGASSEPVAGAVSGPDETPTLEIFVKHLSGATLTCNVWPSDTVASVIRLINVKHGVAVDRLVYAGRPLANGNTLTDYNVQDHSTMFAVATRATRSGDNDDDAEEAGPTVARITVDLFTRAMPLMSSPVTDAWTLQEWGLGRSGSDTDAIESRTVFVVFRYATDMLSSSMALKPDMERVSGRGAFLAATAAWQPVLPRTAASSGSAGSASIRGLPPCVIKQSREGIASALSALYVFAHHATERGPSGSMFTDSALDTVAHLRRVCAFPPALHAVHNLCTSRPTSRGEQAALAAVLFRLVQNALPEPASDPSKVFDHVRVVLGALGARARTPNEAAGISESTSFAERVRPEKWFKHVPFECAATSAPITEAVCIQLSAEPASTSDAAAAESEADAAAAAATEAVAAASEGATDMSRPTAGSLTRFDGLVFDRASLLQHLPGGSDPQARYHGVLPEHVVPAPAYVRRALAPWSHPGFSSSASSSLGDDLLVWVPTDSEDASSEITPAALAIETVTVAEAARRANGARAGAEESKEGAAAPAVATVTSRAAASLRGGPLSEFNADTVACSVAQWEYMARTGGDNPLMRVLEPLGLAGADYPVMTIDENGRVCVYCGRTPCSDNYDMYMPLSGASASVDVHDVAQKLQQRFPGRKALAAAVAVQARPAKEAIVMCIDVSESMSRRDVFREAADEGDGADDIDLEMGRIAPITSLADDDDDAAGAGSGATEFAETLSAAEVERRRARAAVREQVADVVRRIEDILNAQQLAKTAAPLMASAAGRKELLDELPYLVMTEDEASGARFRRSLTRLKHIVRIGAAVIESAIADIITRVREARDARRAARRDARAAGGSRAPGASGGASGAAAEAAGHAADDLSDDSDLDDYSEGAPEAFVCPITHRLMADPVLCDDGHTYERKAITQWLSQPGASRSPMTNAPMSTSVRPNHSMRSQIAEWLEMNPNGAPRGAGEAKDDDAAAAAAGDGGSGAGTGDDREFSVFVRGSVSCTIDARASMTVASFKQQIHAKAHFPVAMQALSYAGRRLINDGATLGAEGVVSAATIVLTGARRHTAASYDSPMLINFKDGRHRWLASTPEAMSVVVRGSLLVNDLILLMWRRFGSSMRPSKLSFWCDLHDTGDGFRRGTLFRGWERLNTYRSQIVKRPGALRASGRAVAARDDGDDDGSDAPTSDDGVIEIDHKWTPPDMSRLTRLETTKQLFSAFVNRCEAYSVPAHIGLVLFGSSVLDDCEITPSFEEFRSRVDDAKPDGDTKMYDALEKARQKLLAWKAAHPEAADATLRVVCLSDGDDTKSTLRCAAVARSMQAQGIVVDSIQIGNATGEMLRAICKCTGGYAFRPPNLRSALRICELETMLLSSDRPPINRDDLPPVVTEAGMLRHYASEYHCPLDKVDDEVVPARREHPNARAAVSTLAAAIAAIAGGEGGGGGDASTPSGDAGTTSAGATAAAAAASATGAAPAGSSTSGGAASATSGQPRSDARAGSLARTRRVLREMRAVLRNPHPNFEVFPCESDIGFWRALVSGPEGSPYYGGVWVCHIDFPPEYPAAAPEVRFVTPIRHPNVNAHGKVCHSLLDRDWMRTRTVRDVQDCVYGLLLTPDVAAPLDTTLALRHYAADGTFEASAAEHTRKYAARPIGPLREAILRMGHESTPGTGGGDSTAPGGTLAAECAKCAKVTTDSGEPLLVCRRCQRTHYCGRECQAADWAKHRRVCKPAPIAATKGKSHKKGGGGGGGGGGSGGKPDKKGGGSGGGGGGGGGGSKKRSSVFGMFT